MNQRGPGYEPGSGTSTLPAIRGRSRPRMNRRCECGSAQRNGRRRSRMASSTCGQLEAPGIEPGSARLRNNASTCVARALYPVAPPTSRLRCGGPGFGCRAEQAPQVVAPVRRILLIDGASERAGSAQCTGSRCLGVGDFAVVVGSYSCLAFCRVTRPSRARGTSLHPNVESRSPPNALDVWWHLRPPKGSRARTAA